MKYKVGDKVQIKSLDWYNENKDENGNIYCGGGIMLNPHNAEGFCGRILTIKEVNSDFYTVVEDRSYWNDIMIEGLVEEETKPNIIEEAKTYWDSIKDALVCPDGYIFKDENGNVINATKIVLEKKKPKYPQSYRECCEVLGFNTTIKVKESSVFDYDDDIVALQKLKRCRDAYWKLAGDWKPEFGGEPYYCITVANYKVDAKAGFNGLTNCTRNTILAFPTAEMRDAFYEYFKELIEECKELL